MGKKKNKLKKKQAISKHSYDKHADCIDYLVNKLTNRKGITLLEVETEYPEYGFMKLFKYKDNRFLYNGR